MKKFIDKESGKIVTVLNVDEAKKILEMYIEYCQGKREVKKGRLNLVNYLGDFIKYSNEKDMAKFYDILLKMKDNLELAKQEQKAYDSLLSFFEIYNKIDKGEFEVSSVTTFITNAISKKQAIDEKISNGQELNFEEKLNNIFFNENFDLSILAKNACNKWDELLKEKINASNGEIEVSLKEEIAYQDLLAFSNKDNMPVSNKAYVEEETIPTETNEDVKDEAQEKEESEEKKEELKIDINSESNEEKTEEIEETKKEEEFVGPIIVNSIGSDSKKEEKDEVKEDKKEENKARNDEDEIIGASSIREATEDVSLRDAANTFNEAIDDIKKNNNQSNSNNGTSFGTLRDM